jgi:HAD superfamily hydrolase (TIGR01509 family)
MSGNIPPFQFLLLDFDGTLVDSESAFARFDGNLLNEAIRNAGFQVNLPYEDVRSMAGMTEEEKFNATEQYVGFDLSAAREDFLQKRRAGRSSLMRDMQVDLQKGVSALLEAHGKRCGLASNKREDKLIRDLEYLGLIRYFENRVWGAEGRFTKKPAPDMLSHIAKDIHIDPSHMAYIGDLPGDMQAAKAAEMTAIGFIDRTSPVCDAQILQESGADFIIEDMSELIPSLEQGTK